MPPPWCVCTPPRGIVINDATEGAFHAHASCGGYRVGKPHVIEGILLYRRALSGTPIGLALEDLPEDIDSSAPPDKEAEPCTEETSLPNQPEREQHGAE